MIKEILTIEFRYKDAPEYEADSEHKTKTLTIGIFDTLEEAVEKGNELLNILSKTFEVRSNDVFSLHGSFGGYPKRLVTNCSYPTKQIQYFAKISKLEFLDLQETIDQTFEARKRYEQYKQTLEL